MQWINTAFMAISAVFQNTLTFLWSVVPSKNYPSLLIALIHFRMQHCHINFEHKEQIYYFLCFFSFHLLFYEEIWFFCAYIITNLFPFFFDEWLPFFLVIPLYLCHLNHQRMRLIWRQMGCYLHLILYLAI